MRSLWVIERDWGYSRDRVGNRNWDHTGYMDETHDAAAVLGSLPVVGILPVVGNLHPAGNIVVAVGIHKVQHFRIDEVETPLPTQRNYHRRHMMGSSRSRSDCIVVPP
jgi:hypothetical protein